MSLIVGTTGNDVCHGRVDADVFHLGQGGSDTAAGRAGDDRFVLGGALDAFDVIDGGAGNDALSLKGDYSAGLVFGATTMTGIETLRLTGEFLYDLTLNDANVAAGERLFVEAPRWGALNFDGSAETDGRFSIRGSIDTDHLIGGDGNDTFHLSQGLGNGDTVNGGGGNDTFKMGGTLNNEFIDGGDGFDTVTVTGGLVRELVLGPDRLINVERLVAYGSGAFDIQATNATVPAGTTFEVDGSAVSTSWFSFSGFDELDGHFDITSGTLGGILQGGKLADVFSLMPHLEEYFLYGEGGGDDISCNTGEEQLEYFSAGESTGVAGHDIVHGFDADQDKFWLTADDATMSGGFSATPVSTTVNTATFDADIGSVSNDAIGPNGGWLVHASGGDLIGHDFLCIDTNGNNVYNAGTDYVIDISGYTGTLDASDFI